MKKKICTTILASAICMPSMALVDIYAGIDYRSTAASQSFSGQTEDLDNTNNLSGYLAFEHFIPLIPNAKLRYSDLSTEKNTDSTTVDSASANAILYYQLFDNGLFEFDLGLAYTRVETDFQSLTADLAQAYGAAKLYVPGTGISAFAELVGGTVSDDKATDAELGLTYTFNPDSIFNIAVRAGYRFQDATISEFKQENKGLFAGMEVHF